MSIHKTKVNELRLSIEEMTQDIDEIIARNDNPEDYENTFKKKYKNIHETSNTLFRFIIQNYGKPSFNKAFFTNTINMMMSEITKIQQAQTSQHDASVNIGGHLAETFIPQLRKTE